jgi:hypothetical protein
MTYHPLLVRSKNAGPFTLTIDVMFADPNDAVRLHEEMTSGLVQVQVGQLAVAPITVYLDRLAAAVKITAGRSIPAGSFGDLDIYGCQQHVGMAAALGISLVTEPLGQP